ncbi:hypothetical protein R1sor_022923 [Riccia sorocarpa]|uniref:Reverse transcriptase zinc-binding domain-containing protein n=1 Tax=Riccia sorocarpa TaxID=122646 RepID=A0ABD3GL90_9MARC
MREFLWGSNAEGAPKKPLIAWKRIQRPKVKGGLGFLSIEGRSKVLQMKHATAILDGKDAEWIAIVRQMVRVWFFFKKILRLSLDDFDCPKELRVSNLKWLWKMSENEESKVFKQLEQVARRLKLQTVEEMVINRGRVLNTGGETLQIHNVLHTQVEKESLEWIISLQVGDNQLHRLMVWSWGRPSLNKLGWTQPNSFWTSLTWLKNPTFKGLIRRWVSEDSSSDWNRRWQLLWNGPGFNSQKLWLWKILHLGFPTLQRAQRWGKSDGICLICNQAIETVPHLFWDCRRLSSRVKWITLRITGEEDWIPMLTIIDRSLSDHKSNPTSLLLLSEFFKVVWKERNDFQFNQKRLTTDPHLILQNCVVQMKGLVRKIKED